MKTVGVSSTCGGINYLKYNVIGPECLTLWLMNELRANFIIFPPPKKNKQKAHGFNWEDIVFQLGGHCFFRFANS